MPDTPLNNPPLPALSDHECFQRKLPIVGIGASAGGLEAFKVFFEKMPANTGIAFVLIPHLDPGHKSLMVEIIGRRTVMPVVQVEDRMGIEPDHIYIIPPDRNLIIENGELVTCEINRTRGINLPVDIFFRSLAIARKESAIGIILSGTMRDGTMGLKDIKAHGGLLIAQSPETAQHDGMPRSAIETGMVDLILAVEDMPQAIIKFITHPYIHDETGTDAPDGLDRVLTVLQARCRHDFRCYKRNTLIRRTERRMGLRQIERMADYVEFLKKNSQETDALLRDLLIGVTGFFREEQVWETVRTQILPPMITTMAPEASLRVWIPGCSTGEEAYTIALLLHDAFENAKKHFNAQIFATDIDEEAVRTARKGVYPETIAANVPVQYLKKYFARKDEEYHISRRVRESVVFAVQNLVGNAPFSNLNLVSCRNLLIYLKPDVQTKVIELFHYSLVDKGCLILGNSETIGYHNDLFETFSKELRLYRRVGPGEKRMPVPVVCSSGGYKKRIGTTRMDVSRQNVSALMQAQLLKRFAPAAVLIDKNFTIMNLHGPTFQYLDLPQGEPVMELTSMIKEGLRLKLRTAVHKAAKRKETITVPDARVKRDNRFHPVLLTVTPIREKEMPDTLFLVTFQDRPVPESEMERVVESDLAGESMVQQLEAELHDTREDLQNTIEELETSNGELKASNEEMMSMNEELQSSNEELETSKEELQSMNEELSTVNAELREKVRELERARNDMVNLMNSTNVATVFLDIHLAIRRYTPEAKHLFNLIPGDVGRPIADLAMRFSDDDLQRHSAKVMETRVPSAKEVITSEGRWYTRRILPFRTQDNQLDGLVLTFADVTDLKEKEIAIQRSEERFHQLFENMHSGVAVYQATHDGEHFIFKDFNKAAEKIEKISRKELIGKDVTRVFPGVVEFGLLDVFRRVFRTGIMEHFPTAFYKDGRIQGWRDNNVYKLPSGEIVAVYDDNTTQKKAEEKIKFQANLLESVGQSVIATDVDGKITYWNKVAELTYGWSAEDVIGKNIKKIAVVPREATTAKKIWEIVTMGKPWSGEFQALRKNGSLVPVLMTDTPIFDENGCLKGVVGVSSDLTERKRMEEKVRSAQKMEAIGTLAGGIAHDFNNILTSIIGFTELALAEASIGTTLEENLREIYASSKRAKELIKQILTLSRHSSKEIKPIHIAPPVIEALKMLRSTIPTSIELKERITREPLVVEADPTQLHQVVVNLATNAKQAMADGYGVLEVSLERVVSGPDIGKHYADIKPGQYARISVSDTGSGIPEEHLDKIFEPYFTTKEKETGTGMGLSVVHGIVKRSRGYIAVTSQAGKGTTFHVYLPLVEKAVFEPAESRVESIVQGTERILFVDDEPTIVKMQQKRLERLGYNVTAKSSSIEALELFRSAPDAFDLVITDMTMPKMTGDRLAMEVKAIRPDVPVLLCTGFSEKIDGKSKGLAIDGFLMKPVDMSLMSNTIRKVLDESRKKTQA